MVSHKLLSGPEYFSTASFESVPLRLSGPIAKPTERTSDPFYEAYSYENGALGKVIVWIDGPHHAFEIFYENGKAEQYCRLVYRPPQHGKGRPRIGGPVR